MMFDLSETYSGHDMPTTTVDGKRHYTTPNGDRYPSVTTVLSSMSAEGIAAWRARVGTEEANRISTQASGRGTRVHQIAEEYLRNNAKHADGHAPADIQMFTQIQRYLDAWCDKVWANEIALYSDELRTAGTCDLIARVHGIRTVTDFKTSKGWKKEEWIKNYFFQCTAYALMLYERKKVWCPQICVLIATDNDGLQPILKQTSQYVNEVRDFFDDYHRKKLLT